MRGIVQPLDPRFVHKSEFDLVKPYDLRPL